MERNQFTFYLSFFKAIQRIRNKAARADAYDAICAYALSETLPDLERLPTTAAMAFEVARPILDASRRKAQCGTANRPQADRKQEQGQEQGQGQGQEQEQGQGQGQGKEKGKEQMLSPPLPPRGGRERRRRQTMPVGSAGTAPLGELEQAALAKMMEGVKRDA